MFIRVLIPVNLKDVLYSIQEVEEGGLVLEDEHVEDVCNCPTIVRQVFGELINLHNSFLDELHVFPELHARLFALQDPIDDTFSRCLILHQCLLDLV